MRRLYLNLFFSQIVASGEVLRELARAKFNGVRTSEVRAARSQPLLVVQLLQRMRVLPLKRKQPQPSLSKPESILRLEATDTWRRARNIESRPC